MVSVLITNTRCTSPKKPDVAKRPTYPTVKPDTTKHFVYPILSKSANSLDDFAPKDWQIKDTVSGDLNKDGIGDFAFTLVPKDSTKVIKAHDFPRILAIAFKFKDRYELKLQHNSLIEDDETDTMGATGGWDGDPFQSMEILSGVLKLHFKWDIRAVGTLVDFVVRYQSNDFYLIGATSTWGHHSDVGNTEFNFSTKRYTYDEFDNDSGFGGEDTENHKKGKLPANSLKKLCEVNGPLDLPDIWAGK